MSECPDVLEVPGVGRVEYLSDEPAGQVVQRIVDAILTPLLLGRSE